MTGSKDLDLIYPKRKPLRQIMKGLLEELAELEHNQWISWTKALVKKHDKDLLLDITSKWKRNWKPYKDLTEKEKGKDRVWARKVINIIERYM